MSLFKSRGKHAQSEHVQPEGIEAENVEQAAAEPAELVDAAENESPVRIEDFVTGSAGEDDELSELVGALEDAPSDDALANAPEANAGESPDDAGAVSAEPSEREQLIESWEVGKDIPTGFVSSMPEGVTFHKKRSVGKIVGTTFGVIVGVLLVAYVAGAIVFMNFFPPNTTVAGMDISMKSNGDVAQMLDGVVNDYTIDIAGQNGFSFHATANDIGMTIDSDATVEAMHSDLNPWTWPAIIVQGAHDETEQLDITCEQSGYDYKIVNAVSSFNRGAVAPTDATIAFNADKNKFEVVPEIPGTQYDSHALLASMSKAVFALEPKITLTDDDLIQPDVFSTDERLINSAELATGLVSANVTLKMADIVVAEINGQNLSQFVHLDENLGVVLDEEGLNNWVVDLSNGFDTVGTERTYTRPDGKVITVSGGAYGWITDAAGLKDQVMEAIKAGQTTTIDIPCEQTAATYNGPGQPDWGSRYIDVDLSEQYVRFYDGDSVIWESACISGSPDGEHNTWPGVWYITNMQSPSKLIGYLPSGEKEYETTVQFWMAFEGNGIGLHDATWQPAFGGSMYAQGYGSHGCVNLPYDAAESLYYMCSVGTPVIAHF